MENWDDPVEEEWQSEFKSAHKELFWASNLNPDDYEAGCPEISKLIKAAWNILDFLGDPDAD